MADDFSWTITGTTKWSKKYDGKRSVTDELFGALRTKLVPPIVVEAHRFIADFRSARSRSYHTERRTEPFVLPSETSGLERLHALVKVENLVLPFSFPYLAPLKSQQGFIPRASARPVVEIDRRAPELSGTLHRLVAHNLVGQIG
jgi:hypothetical protein